jgi:hypothetical protein
MLKRYCPDVKISLRDILRGRIYFTLQTSCSGSMIPDPGIKTANTDVASLPWSSFQQGTLQGIKCLLREDAVSVRDWGNPF